jgi:hypothetical protein
MVDVYLRDCCDQSQVFEKELSLSVAGRYDRKYMHLLRRQDTDPSAEFCAPASNEKDMPLSLPLASSPKRRVARFSDHVI